MERPWTKGLDGLPLFTLREIEAFLETLEKRLSWMRKLNNCYMTISMKITFFYVRAICGASYRKENHKLCFTIKSHLQLLNMLTVPVELAKEVGVIMFMH